MNHNNVIPKNTRKKMDKLVFEGIYPQKKTKSYNPKAKHFLAFSVATGVLISAGTLVTLNLTGDDTETGLGDVIVNGQVVSQSIYYHSHPNQHTYNGFVYNDALNLTVGFDNDESLQEFMEALKPLQTSDISADLTSKFAGKHIDYKGTLIDTTEFSELHKDNKATFVKCYAPEDLIDGNIRAYDNKEEFDADKRLC